MRVQFCASCISLLLLVLDASCGCEKSKDAGIVITVVPPIGSGPNGMERIEGKVTDARSDYRVLIYSHAGDRWWVQPYENAPYTTIEANGSWGTRIHLGYEYAALLVCRGHKPVLQPISLPEVGGEILAIDVKPASTARAGP